MPRRLLRALVSLPVVFVIAVVSQVVVIGGSVWWAYQLGQAATGSLPAFPEAAIYIYVSDPRWEIAPNLRLMGRDEWDLSFLGPVPPDPGAKAILVLTGAARLRWPSPMYSRAYLPEVQLPSDPPPTAPMSFLHMTSRRPDAGGGPSTVPAQIFEITGRDLYGFSLEGAPQPSLVKQTSTGWSAYVPALGSTAYGSSPNDCRSAAVALPDAIVKAVSHRDAALAAWDRQHSWYRGSCPAWEPGIHLELRANEHLDHSSIQAYTTPSDITWSDNQEGTGHDPGRLPEFSFDIGVPDIAARAQRDLLFAGVLYGLAGGLTSAWIVAAVTFLVTKAARAHATAKVAKSQI
jgi:hypothetical protein